MNTPFLRALLDLEEIPDGAEHVRLAFERQWPAWAWILVVLGVGILAAWSYSRLAAPRRARGALAAVRALLLLLVVVLVAGPLAEMPREIVERDQLVLLIDRSASLGIADAPPDRATRDAQLRRALADAAPALVEIGSRKELSWLGFAGATWGLEGGADGSSGAVVELGDADGRPTDLDGAISQALDRAQARPLSAIVLFSDGRTARPPARPLLRRLQEEAIPIVVVPLGSADPIGDLSVAQIQAPSRAFVRDRVPVVVAVDRLGEGAAGAAAAVRLVDVATGAVLDERPLESSSGEVTLVAEPQLAGSATWRVEIVSDRTDLVPMNDVRTFEVELVDRPLRVLFIDGYPRWEYRYIKNLLVREESIESAVMLLSADRDFAQEGNEPITRLPRTREEWGRYDVVILGDVPAGFFTVEQLEQIRDHVAIGGAGLLWVAGERDVPSSFEDTPLADLLPMRGPLRMPPIGRPVNMVPTMLAERLGVLNLALESGDVGWPSELVDAQVGWSRLHWAQRIEPGRLKPTAEVLAATTEAFGDGPLPLVVQLRYGSGQSIYVATDEVWRWRFGRGELLPEQFWIQMVRMLGRESLARSGDVAVLDVEPRRVEVGRPLRFSVSLLDAQLLDDPPASLVAVISDASGATLGEVELRAEDERGGEYAAAVLPDAPGVRTVRVRIGSDGPALEGRFEVLAPDDELRRPEADHELLARLASESGGRVVAPRDLADLGRPGMLPDRSVRTPAPIRERLWDTPLALALFLILAAIEWTGRKLIGVS